MFGFSTLSRIYSCIVAGLKGLPFLGNVPRLIREVRSNKAAEENWLHKLHSELGPIYRLKVIGKYRPFLTYESIADIIELMHI